MAQCMAALLQKPAALVTFCRSSGKQTLKGDDVQAEGARALPWFGAVQGFSLVPPEGSCGSGGSGEMAALIVLSEGGQLMVHDLRTLQPVPLSLPFQELPPVTASAFAPGEPLAGEVRFCLISIIIFFT